MKKSTYGGALFAGLALFMLTGCESLPRVPELTNTTLYAPTTALRTVDPVPNGFAERLVQMENLAGGARKQAEVDLACKSLVQPLDWQDNLNLMLLFSTKEALVGTITSERLSVQRLRNASRQLNWFPPQLEAYLGERKFKEVEALVLPREGRRNQLLYDKVDSVFAQLIENIGEVPPYDFRIFILQSNRGLVQALPGGTVLIDRNVVADEGDVALSFKLAHELAHVLQRHTTAMYQARLIDGLETVENAVKFMKGIQTADKSDRNASALGTGVEAYVSVKKMFSDFTADQESNADACAYKMLTQGKNKRKFEIADFHALVKTFGDPVDEKEMKAASNEDKFISFLFDGQFERHPSTEMRRKHLATLWKSQYDAAMLRKFDQEFAARELVFSKQREKSLSKSTTAGSRQAQLVAQKSGVSGFTLPETRPLDAPAKKTERVDPDSAVAVRLAALSAQSSTSKFVMTPTGIKLGDQVYTDAEGKIVASALQEGGNSFTYVVQRSALEASLKKVSAAQSASPVLIGNFKRSSDGGLLFESVGGRQARGTDMRVMDGGLITWQGKLGFRFTPERGLVRIKFPEEWSPAVLQKGDIASTGWILLERDELPQQTKTSAAIRELARTLRTVEANDFALFNLDDERLILLDVSSGGKQVTVYGDCEDKGKLINKCKSSASSESLWGQFGLKNSRHYFWTIDWFRFQGRTLMIALESSNSKINAYDLDKSVKVQLMERLLGYPGFDISQEPNGKLNVVSNMLVYKERVDDVLSRFEAPVIPATVSADQGPEPAAVPASESNVGLQ